MPKISRPQRLATSPLTAAVLAALLGAAASPSTALATGSSVYTCYALEQNCLANLAKTRAFVSRVQSSAPVVSDATALLNDVCYNAAAAARQTGVWPAYKAMPAVPCTN